MKLSLCMIVKNEEDNLRKCLVKVGRYIEEIIVVDTGSTDRTKEIARGYNAKFYDFSWCENFSAARNFSLEKASNDWVLVLDADEVVIDFNVKDIQNIIQYNNPIVGRIKVINFLSDATGGKRSSEWVSRLFNRRFFHYEGIVHEQVVQKNGSPYKTVSVGITVEHSGYTPEVIQRTDKIARNITLLEKALKKKSEDAYLLYQLGKANYMAQNYNGALDYFKRALTLPVNYDLEYVKNLVETYGYALINSGRYAESLCLENYELYYGSSTDFRFLMGLVSMNNGRFTHAIEYFSSCIGDKKGKVEGINSYLPNYNIAVIYDCLGYKADAISYYRKCGNYPLALKRIRKIL